jgi:hypothetical protein
MLQECNHDILISLTKKDEPFLCFPKTRKFKCQLCGKEMLILQYKMCEEVKKELEKMETPKVGEQLEFDFMGVK